MKTSTLPAIILFFFVVSVRGQVPGVAGSSKVPAPTPYTIVSQGANHRIWQRETFERGPNGGVVTNINHYTELATGLNHLVGGRWVASKEDIKVSPDGTSAAATDGEHQAYFPGNIYDGVIKLVTPGGKILRSRPIGLAYSDGSNSVLLAVITNATGAILPSGNQVIYKNAFSGLSADLLYTYTKAGFEQDVVLREQPPEPAALGLNPQTTRLQVLTEFFNPPQPRIRVMKVRTAAGKLENDSLRFGTMAMGQGRAFMLDSHAPSAQVDKRWLALKGRQFLIEEVPIVSIARDIDALPPFVSQSGLGTKPVASKHLVLPPQRLARSISQTRFLALALPPNNGLVLDYLTLDGSLTNYDFRADTTYYLSGPVYVYGTNNILEGGAVLKYTNNASLNFPYDSSSRGQPFTFQGGPYRPVIFTAIDDNSVGQTIPGSTGMPAGYYASPALSVTAPYVPPSINHFRIAYARQAISLVAVTPAISDGQIVNCQNGIGVGDAGASIENMLFANTVNDFNSGPGDPTVENATFCGSSLLANASYFSISCVNCILADVTNLYSGTQVGIGGSYNGFYNCPEFGSDAVTNDFYPFTAAGAGDYYLTNGCDFFNAGTANIDSALLAELQTKTTYPPIVLSNVTVSIDTTLAPRTQRDFDTPDLGYHYDPIDYLVDEFWITNATLTVTNGVAIACYNDGAGIGVTDGGSIDSIGSPLAPNWFVRYSSVQEQPVPLGGEGEYPSEALMVNPWHSSSAPNGYFRFTKFACPADGGDHLYDYGNNWFYSNLRVQDCEFWSGASIYDGGSNTVTTLNNNLFVRSSISTPFQTKTNSYFYLTNNLFWGVSPLHIAPLGSTNWSAFDNAFDSCSNITAGPRGGFLNNGYNAFLNCNSYLQPTNSTDIFLTNSMAYETGPLGTFYQPAGTLLFEAGSTTADKVGLYHFTTQTALSYNSTLHEWAEVPEGTNIVSIGYHYVATDANGNPLDSNGDGIPDYLEDANGNGLVDPGEIGWNIPGDLGLKVIITQPRNGSILP